MTFSLRSVPFQEDLLDRLATDLLALSDPTGALVLLPSSRACRTLGHRLLEKSGAEAFLLPRILTVGQMEGELLLALGLDDAGLPGDRARSLLLAHRLQDEAWLADRKESAPGLAREYLDLFDEARRHGKLDALVDEGRRSDLSILAGAQAADQQEAELARIGRVWSLYRRAVARDGVDLLVALAEKVAQPASRPVLQGVVHANHLLVAGFASVDPLRGAIMRAEAEVAGESHLYLPEAEADLSRFFCETWSGPARHSLGPLAPARRVMERLGQPAESGPEPENALALRDRVAALGDRTRFWAPQGTLELLACGTVEEESLVVTDRVVQVLSRASGAAERTAIVTNDPGLAARVVAQLRDAGIDSDQTLGTPLSGQPAGLLLRFMLRTALTDFRADGLLEVVTHPFVEIPVKDRRGAFWALRLERMLRRHLGSQPGADGLLKMAAERDEDAQSLTSDAEGDQRPGLAAYVQALQDALAPLTDLSGKLSLGWAEGLRAIRQAWNNLCPELLLAENRERSDLTALSRLLDDLAGDAHLLPPTNLSGMTADLGRMLSAESVAPHRGQAKPVLVVGTVEARLERFDHLIMCGMADGTFPARRSRPLFLGASLRRHLRLPDWRDPNARDAELFLRLIHNAPRVLITWPTQAEGRDVLPSPFVERLCLALPEGESPRRARTPGTWRQPADMGFDPVPRQTSFAAEGLRPVAVHEVGPLNRLSWSALRQWRDCHYRYLLGRGLRLHKEDEVREEFGRRDFGTLVHLSLRRFLDPKSGAQDVLVAGRADEAEEILRGKARGTFLENDDDSALRRLWLDNFQRCAASIVHAEIQRFVHWRPVLREHDFTVSLAQLLACVRTLATAMDWDGTLPADEKGDADIILSGTIDRVDQQVDSLGSDEPVVSVIDYKTGKLPTQKELEDLEDLQIVLYALVLEVTRPGMRVQEGSYYAIDFLESGPPQKIQLPPGRRELLIQGGLELVRMARLAADPQATFDLVPRQIAGVGPTNMPCRWCDLRGVCRLEEKMGLPGPVATRLDQLVNRKEGQW